MQEGLQEVLAQRLASASGHLKGIERMAQQEDAGCIHIIRQIQAVQGALDKVSLLLLDHHLHTCLEMAVQGQDAVERARTLSEVSAIFEAYRKINLTAYQE